MDKKRIFIFSILIVLIICGMVLTYIVATNTNKGVDHPAKTKVSEETHQPSNNNQTHQSSTPTNQTVQNEHRDPNEPITSDVFKRPEKTNTESITAQKARTYEDTARGYFQKFEFLKGSESLYEATKKYKEDGNGEILYTLYQDSSMLANIEHSADDDTGTDEGVTSVNGMYDILNSVRDPEMALLGLLSIDFKNRNKLIPSLDSLNPVFQDNDIQIISKSEETGDILDNLSTMYGATKAYRIDFMLDGYALYAYIMQNKEGYSRLYAIYAEQDGTTNFLTVDKWNQMLNQSSQPKTTDATAPSNQSSESTKKGGN